MNPYEAPPPIEFPDRNEMPVRRISVLFVVVCSLPFVLLLVGIIARQAQTSRIK